MSLVKQDKTYYSTFKAGKTVRWMDGRRANPRQRTGIVIFVEEDGVQVYNELTKRSYFLKRPSMRSMPSVNESLIDFKKGSLAAEKIE